MEEQEKTYPKNNRLSGSILIGAALIAGAVLMKDKETPAPLPQHEVAPNTADSTSNIAPTLVLPWGDLGGKLVSVGALDREAFLSLYSGTPREKARRLIDTSESVTVTKQNAGIILNLLWGLGLAQKSPVLEKGMMMEKRFGGADKFASTAGFTIARGDPMEHYSHHLFMSLSPESEELVARVASNIYRPCCDNATHFPDCNHGMAMLGLLELLISQGSSEQELYDAALVMNRLWFPEQYVVIDRYMRSKGEKNPDAKTLLSKSLVSASGFAKVSRDAETPSEERESGGGGGCSV